jgi:hypothetical protein
MSYLFYGIVMCGLMEVFGMVKQTVEVKIKIAWWFRYLYDPVFWFGCQFIVDFIDADFEPNHVKYAEVFSKAVKFEYI